MINTTEFKGDWKRQMGILKQVFASLTENDFLFAEGKRDEIMGRIQIKLGKTREELDKILVGFYE